MGQNIIDLVPKMGHTLTSLFQKWANTSLIQYQKWGTDFCDIRFELLPNGSYRVITSVILIMPDGKSLYYPFSLI